MMNVPVSSLAKLGKTAGWRKLFGQYSDELGDAFVSGPVQGITRPSGMSSRGFAGTSNRNPLQPDFASAGPRVSEGSASVNIPQGTRTRHVATGTRNEAAEAQAAIRAEHVDSSNFGRLKRLLQTQPGQMGAVGAGGLAAGGAVGASMGEEQIDPELLALLQARGLA
jgi:hypothetical protein